MRCVLYSTWDRKNSYFPVSKNKDKFSIGVPQAKVITLAGLSEPDDRNLVLRLQDKDSNFVFLDVNRDGQKMN